MNSWVLPALGCFMMWGLSRFFPKVATQYIDPRSAFFFEVTGEALVALAILASIGFKPSWHVKGVGFALVAGLFGGLGVYFYLLGAQRGNVSQLVVVSAMYPVITVLLGLFLLGETVTVKQAIGMVFALIAIVLVVT